VSKNFFVFLQLKVFYLETIEGRSSSITSGVLLISFYYRCVLHSPHERVCPIYGIVLLSILSHLKFSQPWEVPLEKFIFTSHKIPLQIYLPHILLMTSRLGMFTLIKLLIETIKLSSRISQECTQHYLF
jgi:hypothetical protein